MANYFLNDDGTTSLKRKNRKNGKNYIQQDDGSTIEEKYNEPKKTQLPKSKSKENEKFSFSNSIKNLGDTINNGAVKNHGLNLSNVITDIANINDARKDVAKSIPVAGKLFEVGDTAVNTAVNTATNLGTGAMKGLEGTADFVSDLIVNPLERRINYAIDYAKNGKKVADENLKDLKKMQQRDIKKDLTKEFQDKVGYSDVVDDLEKNSLVRRDNLGGQVAQAVGGMVPALVMGQAFIKTPAALQSTKGLKGLEKAKVITGNVGKSFVKQLPSNALLGTSSYGSGVEEALNNGATLEQARLYGIGSSAKEMATEWITGGIPGLGGKGGLDLPAEKLINKTTGKIKNEYAKAFAKTLANYGYKFIGEGLEEGLSEIIDPYLKNATYSNGEKVNWQDVFSSFIVGGLTGGFLEAPNTIADFKNNIVEVKSNIQKKKALLPVANNNDVNNNLQQQNDIEGNPLVENNSQVGLPLDSNTIQKMSGINQNQERFVYESSDNSKIDNFRKSANQFMNNSDETKSFVQTVEKVINDKNYNVTFDNSLGDNVNGRIGINDNGEVDIRINPNSDRAGEFVLTHEITHAIETDEMKNLVMNYASKNAEFNDALESLKQTYGVDDVNDEVLADISGQLLGTEEFINKLSTTKPNLFKRIYDKIISFANKITGNSRESLFIKDLKNKWEKAYRNQSSNLGSEEKYMMTSVKGMEQGLKKSEKYQGIKDRYDAALWLENKVNKNTNNKYTNEEIRKITGWFKDKEGNWEFEISDKNTRILNNIFPNTSYKLSEIFEAKALYDLYPELKDVSVLTKNIKNNGSFHRQENKMVLNNKLLSDPESLRGTILHEIQHYIQNVEGLPTGTTTLLGNERYANSKGEIEAADTKNRRDMSVEERKKTAPESSKKNPIHPNREAILGRKRSIKEKIIEKIYNFASKSEKADDIVDNVIDKFYNEYGDDIYENFENYEEKLVNQITHVGSENISDDGRKTRDRLGNRRQNDVNKELNSSFSLEQRVSGDELLDAQDLIEEVKSVGAKVDKNGYVTLYHQTTTENANKIKQSGKMIAKEPYVYFSTSKSASQSDGRGTTKLEFKIPAEKLILDDIFADNADVKVRLNSNKELDVSNYMVKNTQELENSSFSLDKNAKQYDDLTKTNTIEYFRKDNGDVKVYLMDSNNNVLNEFSLWSDTNAIKELGEKLGNKIYETATDTNQKINIGNDIYNLGNDTDYFMNHRPSSDYGNASNFEENMSGVFEHPEWYMNMNDAYNKESLMALQKVQNKPEAEIKIYRATIGDKINPGDWITPSKKYAEYHNSHQLDGKGKILEMTVKAKDILFAGDDINEFGYFPESEKYSKKNGSWQEFVERNFKSKGTRTNFENTRLNINNTEKNLINKETEKITKKYEREKNKNKKIITKEASKILEFDDYQQKRKFTDLVSEYYDNPDLNKIKQDIKENFSEKRIEYVNDYVKDIKKVIRETDLQITDYVRKNLTDFGNFRKENFNKLKLKNQGQSIDSFYNELSEDYPSVFSKNITNEVDQLERLSEFMNEDDKFYEKYNLDDNVINEAAQYVYDSIKNKDNIDDLINSISISPKQIRKEKTVEYKEYAEKFVNNSDDWIDKKIGLSYKTNTMKRNFYDSMGKKDGERIYHNYIEPIFNHNAQMQNDISLYNKKIAKLKLNDKESTAVQMFGEYKYNPETLVTGMEIDEFITKNKLDHEKIENAVEVFRSTYDELIERVNETLKSQGYKEIDYRKGYFPHFVEEGAKTKFGKILEKMGWKFKDDSVPTDIAGITDIFKPGKVWNRNAQQRKGKYTDFNALKGFDNYVRGAMETIYFTEDIQKLRALENEIRYQHSEKGVQTQIDEILSDNSIDFDERQEKIDKIFTKYRTPLNNLVSEIRDYTNSIANKKSILDRTMEQATNRKVYSVMQNVSSRLSANMVACNLSSAITNFIPITQAASQVKSKYLIKGLREAIKNQAVADNFESKSVFLTSRLKEADRLYKTKWEKASDKASVLFDGIDSITANTIVRGKYYENIAKGMSEYNARRNADEFARDLMAGRTKGEMPTIFNSKNPLVKLFTSFQLEVNNQYQYMFKDLPRDLADEGKNKLVSAFIKMFFGAWIYNQLTEKVVGRKSAFSPVDTIKEVYDTTTNPKIKTSDKMADTLENLTQDIPFVGGLIGGGRLPISSASNPLKILRGESTVKDEAKKAFYYTVLPFGGGQLKKTIDGASMYVNNKNVKGSYTSKGQLRFEAEKNPAAVAQALLFGQYASKNARQYFDNSYSPLTDKQLKEVEKIDISVSKYRKYQDDKKEINKIKSDKDPNGKSINGSAAGKKAYLIMNSNFSKKEKNYLLSKIGNSKVSVKVDDLEQIPNDKKIYKFYFGLNKDSKKDFINEIKNYNVDPGDLYNYYSKRQSLRREYTSGFAKKEMVEYIKNSKFDEKTKWYLYNKDYGSDISELLVNTFGIKTDDYFNTMEYADKIAKDYPNTKQASIRKRKVFEYINNLKCSQKQKIVLFSRAGYSTSEFKNSMYTYINGLKLTQSEKEKIWNSLY